MADTDQVAIARISAKQAIIVALITSMAGLLGAGIQKYGFDTASAAPVQDEVRFRGIEFHGAPAVKRYRVVIDVDGTPYSYPGRSVWKDAGPKISELSFPLKAGVSKHSVGIEIFAEAVTGEELVGITDQDKVIEAGSGMVNLRVLKRGGLSRAVGAFATVQLEIVPSTSTE